MPVLDLLTRRAALAPASINEAERTVEVVWSTGAPVKRRDSGGSYTEVLSLDPAHVDTAGLIGASVLDGHRQDSVDRVLGVVVAATTDGREGRATIKISERAEAVWRDIQAGILRHVSVGYAVQQWQDGKAADGSRVRTAVRWTPREISLVPVPADPGATIRSQETPMADTETQDTTADAPLDRAAVNVEIRKLAGLAKLDQPVIDGMIDRGLTVEAARAEMFDALVQRGGEPIRHHRVDLIHSHDDPAVRATRMQEALVARIQGLAPKAEAQPYMQIRIVDMAAELLELRGEKGLRYASADTVLQRALHTTSDFPNLLTGTGNRVLMASYEAAASPLKAIARQTTIADFRSKTSLRLSEFPALEQVNEAGEIKFGSRGEAKEAYSLKTFGKRFGISRNALINDDLGAFGDFSRAAGQAAAETEANQLAGLLTANAGAGATMDDGKALFHADHGNKAASGTVVDVTNLGVARKALRDQKGLDGTTPINVVPKYLLVGSAKETEAEKVLADISAAVVGEVNPFAGKLSLLVEPRLSGNAWRVFADPATAPTLEYAYLSSAQGPQMASREGWDILGMEFRVYLDFGCGALDWRGAYLNAGA